MLLRHVSARLLFVPRPAFPDRLPCSGLERRETTEQSRRSLPTEYEESVEELSPTPAGSRHRGASPGHALRNCGSPGSFGAWKSGRWLCPAMILTAWGTWAQSLTPETGVAEGEQVQKMRADVPDEKRIFFPSYFFVRDRSLSLPHTATCRPAGAIPMAERVSSLFQRVQRSMQTHAHALSCPESQHKGAARRPRSVEGHGESPSLQRRFAAGPVPLLLRVTSGGRLSGPGGQELLNEGLSPANRGKSDVRPRHRVSALATAGADG